MAQTLAKSEGAPQNSGMNDSDSDSSFLQNIEMQKSTAQSPNPLPAPPPQQNPLNSVSNQSHNHAMSHSKNLSHELANYKPIEHSESRNHKWLQILLVICILYSFIGVTFLLYMHFANMSNVTNCECISSISQQVERSENNTTWPPSISPTPSVYKLSLLLGVGYLQNVIYTADIVTHQFSKQYSIKITIDIHNSFGIQTFTVCQN